GQGTCRQVLGRGTVCVEALQSRELDGIKRKDVLEIGVVRVDFHEFGGNPDRRSQVCDAGWFVAGQCERAAEDGAHGEHGGALAVVAGILGRQRRLDPVVGRVFVDRGGEVALQQRQFAEVVVGAAKLALPIGLVRLGSDQPLREFERVAVCGRSPVQLATRLVHVAQVVVDHLQFELRSWSCGARGSNRSNNCRAASKLCCARSRCPWSQWVWPMKARIRAWCSCGAISVGTASANPAASFAAAWNDASASGRCPWFNLTYPILVSAVARWVSAMRVASAVGSDWKYSIALSSTDCMMSSRCTCVSLSVRSPSMKLTRPSACFCRRSAACRAITASWRAINATIASKMVTDITANAVVVSIAMRRMRRCCSRCFSASKPTSSMPAISFSLAFCFLSLPGRASAAIGSVRSFVGWPFASSWKRSAGQKHSSASRPCMLSVAFGSPSTIRQKMRSARPMRLYASTSSFTQREVAAAGEQITIWFSDWASASLTLRPRSVALASSSRSRKTGFSRRGMVPCVVVVPTNRDGTLYVSSALCSQSAHALSRWL